MKKGKKIVGMIVASLMVMTLLGGCEADAPSADNKQATATETLMQQANAKLGLPNIVNFKEKQDLKTIMEACDDSKLITYTYIKADMTGKLVYIGETMGYGVPYSTEYTNPSYISDSYQGGYAILPQADPNGLYKAQGVNATWIMLINPATKTAKPFYEESDITVSPFKLDRRLCDVTSLPSDY